MYSNRSSNFGWVAAIVLAVVAIFGIGLLVHSYYGDDVHTGCVVSDKDRVSKSEGGSDMRIYTDNCGVFVVKDSFIKTDFRSSDRYAHIKVGKTYDIKSYGWRIGLFSEFPKIISATEVR